MDAVVADGDPLWTTMGSWTVGLDPLGLQSTSITIYQTLVPSVTNITNRLRYYFSTLGSCSRMNAFRGLGNHLA